MVNRPPQWFNIALTIIYNSIKDFLFVAKEGEDGRSESFGRNEPDDGSGQKDLKECRRSRKIFPLNLVAGSGYKTLRPASGSHL